MFRPLLTAAFALGLTCATGGAAEKLTRHFYRASAETGEVRASYGITVAGDATLTPQAFAPYAGKAAWLLPPGQPMDFTFTLPENFQHMEIILDELGWEGQKGGANFQATLNGTKLPLKTAPAKVTTAHALDELNAALKPGENRLTVTAPSGAPLGILGLKVFFQSPKPSGKSGDKKITLLAPRPGQALDTSKGVVIAWETENFKPKDTVTIYYAIGDGELRPLKDFTGIPYNTPAKKGNRGRIVWKTNTNTKLTGIGVQLGKTDGLVTINKVSDGGPAQKSGLLKAGDRILTVSRDSNDDMVPISHVPFSEIVDLIRGKNGTTVRLGVLPKGAPKDSPPKTVDIVRGEIDLGQLRVAIGIGNPVPPNTVQVGPNRTYQTVGEAISDAKPGYTILIDEGVYEEKHLIIDKKLTLKGAGRGKTKLHFRGASWITTKAEVHFKDLHITENTKYGLVGNATAINSPSAYLRLSNVEISSCQLAVQASKGGYLDKCLFRTNLKGMVLPSGNYQIYATTIIVPTQKNSSGIEAGNAKAKTRAKVMLQHVTVQNAGIGLFATYKLSEIQANMCTIQNCLRGVSVTQGAHLIVTSSKIIGSKTYAAELIDNGGWLRIAYCTLKGGKTGVYASSGLTLDVSATNISGMTDFGIHYSSAVKNVKIERNKGGGGAKGMAIKF